jgi:excisionase family DNA binding protein
MKTNELPLYSLNLGQFKELVKELLNDIQSDKNLNNSVGKEDDKLLKIDDLCTLFKVSKVTIFAWIKKGKLKAIHIGSRLYFKKRDIDVLLNNNKS